MENKEVMFSRAVRYANEIITEASGFMDFAIAMLDYIGVDICPYCRTIYPVIVAGLPENVSGKLKTDTLVCVEKCTDQMILYAFEKYREEQGKEERKREIKENIDELFALVKKYRNKEEFWKLLEFVGKSHYMAPYNAMLVRLQKPGCTFVFNVKGWRRYNRQPKPNAQNLITLVPFGPVQCMFDYSDTEHIKGSGPETTIEGLMKEWDNSLLKTRGKVSAKEFDNLTANLPEYGICIDDNFNAGNTYGGYIMNYDGGDLTINIDAKNYINFKSRFIISVNKNQTRECAFHTICHELGHLFCRHIFYDRSKKRHLSLKEREFEAETVAWLVCKRHGVDNPSEEYLVGYSQDGKIPMISLDFVMRAVAEIEKMLSAKMFVKKCMWYKEDKALKQMVDRIAKEIKNSSTTALLFEDTDW